MKKHNKSLAGIAKQAGVIQPVDYTIFMDHGYPGLYGGLGMRDIHERKRLKTKEHVLGCFALESVEALNRNHWWTLPEYASCPRLSRFSRD